jgi:hypothetical protein
VEEDLDLLMGIESLMGSRLELRSGMVWVV